MDTNTLNVNKKTQPDLHVLALVNAIKQKESGGNYNAVGDAGTSKGAFQYQPNTWKSYSKEILGVDNAEMTPENQFIVTYGKIKKLKDDGKNPAEIASIWNSGSDKNWTNKVGINTINGQHVNYNVPQYVKDVTEGYKRNYQSLKSKIDESLNIGDYINNEAIKPLAIDDNIEIKSDRNFLAKTGSNYIKDITESQQGIADIIMGDSEIQKTAEENIRGGFEKILKEGDITGAMDVAKGVIRPSLRAGGKFVSAITSPITELPVIKQGLESVGKGVSKIPYVGEALQKYPEITQDVFDVLDIAGLSGSKAITKGFKKTIDVAKEKGANIIQDQTEKAVSSLEDSLFKITSELSPTKQKKYSKLELVEEAKNKLGTEGELPQTFLAKRGIVPKTEGTKFQTLEQAKDILNEIKPLKEVNRQSLSEIDKIGDLIDLNEYKKLLTEKVRTPSNINTGSDKILLAKIDNYIDNLKYEYGNKINLSKLDEIKSDFWDKAFKNKGLLETDVLSKNADYLMGNTAKELIENTAKKMGYDEVAQINRNIGDIINASKFLDDLNNKAINGGKLTKTLAQLTGAFIGSNAGGSILDGLIGYGIGGTVSKLLVSNYIANPIKRMLLKNVQKTDPLAYIKAKKWLEKNKIDIEERLRLPAGPELGTDKNPIIPKNVDKSGVDVLGQERLKEYYRNIIEKNKISQEQKALQDRLKIPAISDKSSYVEKIILPTSIRETNLGLDLTKNMVRPDFKLLNNVKDRLKELGKVEGRKILEKLKESDFVTYKRLTEDINVDRYKKIKRNISVKPKISERINDKIKSKDNK